MEVFNMLSSLTQKRDIRTFSVSPENLTGEKGGGARATLENGSAASEARELGEGWKVNPYIVLDAGNTAILAEEVGEVARIMARKYGEQSFKEGDKTELADELADVLWVLTCIANQTGTDLTQALEKNFEKKSKRDNKRHINNPKLK